MHGLVLVTWERYLTDHYGQQFLHDYRTAIGASAKRTLLTNRIYDDAALVEGVRLASALAVTPPDTLLHDFGRYFMLNGLTSRLCAYLLNQVQSARDLLLMMRSAHAQLGELDESLAPPLFEYRMMHASPTSPALGDAGLVLLYDSPRQLCPLLWGAIEGAAERYGEVATIAERACMRHGAPACQLEVRFAPQARATGNINSRHEASLEQQARWITQQQLADHVYGLLPEHGGQTLENLRTQLAQHYPDQQAQRPYVLLQALYQLEHAGLIASTANQPGDTLAIRRYWRIPRVV